MSAANTEIEEAVLAHAAPLAALGHHANVVLVYYCGAVEHPDSRLRVPAMVMEFIEGMTLGELLREFIPYDRAIAIGSAVSAGLLNIHSKGLIHGDLHDDNIMIPTSGGAKLIDLMNDKTISKFTAGAQRLGTNDDVEALKAVLANLLTRTPRAAVATAFSESARRQTTVAGVRATFEEVTRPQPLGAAVAPPLAEFLIEWGSLERLLQDRVLASGGAASGGRRPSHSVGALVERLGLAPEIRDEINSLRRLRNTAVHGEPGLVDHSMVQRTRELVAVLDGGSQDHRPGVA